MNRIKGLSGGVFPMFCLHLIQFVWRIIRTAEQIAFFQIHIARAAGKLNSIVLCKGGHGIPWLGQNEVVALVKFN